ncbi:MAG: cache domain-containing protein [Desulfuromonadales bacterium]
MARTIAGISLRTKLIIACAAMAVIPLFLLYFMTFKTTEQALLKTVFERNKSLAANIAEDIDQMFEEKIRMLKIAAGNTDIQSMDAARLVPALSPLTAQHHELLMAIVLAPDGDLLARSDGKQVKANYSDREYFHTATRTGKTTISDVLRSKTTGKLDIGIAEPIKNPDQSLRGMLVIGVSLHKIIDRIAMTRIGTSGYAYVVNKSGKILMHPDRSLVDNSADFSGLAPVKAVISGQSGAVEFEYNGRKTLASYNYLPTTGWGLVVQQPLGEAMAAVNTLRNTNIMIMIVTMLAAVIIVFVLAGVIFKPISLLTAAVGKVADGDFTAQARFKSSDEIGALAAAFNNMTAQLQREETARHKAEEAMRETNDMFALFMRYSPVYVFIKEVDSAGSRVLQASENFQEMVGVSGSDMIGKLMTELFPAEFAAKITADDQDVIAKSDVLKIDEELNGRSYTTFKFPLTLGKRTLLAGYTIDITERKQAEERFRSLVENSIDVIFVIDTDGIFRFVSPAWEKHFGHRTADVLNKSFVPFAHPDDAELCFDYLMKVVTTGEAATSPIFRVKHLNGSYRSFISNGSTYLDASGRPLYLGIGRDISDQLRTEEERYNLEKQLLHAQKLESLGVLAGGIAHDFNNILMAIIGNADLALMRINKESPATENLHRIEQAAARAADLAKQMLAYSGKGKFVVENIDLNILLEEMLHMLEVSISKKAVLRLNLHTPLPTVEADATQMRQIIMNLVINASEAIGDKSGVIAITTGCMDCDRNYLKDVWLDENISAGLYVYLEIADTGCGMDKTIMAKLFDPFFTTKFTGRGLGMAAVLGIVRGHKGAIKVYSEPNRGTTFKILLPASDRPAELFNGHTHTDDWKGSGKVLLVDDEETVRGIGSEMLKELGFEPVTACDGREALEMFRQLPDIAFVILDLTMPHMDGEHCFRELRRIRSDIRVIMSSGYNEQEVTQKFVGKGLAGFIQKPYKLSVLRDAVRGII